MLMKCKSIILSCLLIFVLCLYCRTGQTAGAGSADLDALTAELQARKKLTFKSALPRLIVIEFIQEGEQESGAAVLSEFLVNEFKTRSGVLQSRKIEILSLAADGIICLERFGKHAPRADVMQWLFSSNKRLKLITGIILQKDNLNEVVHIIETLYDHDVKERDTFFKLIIALAVVWDQPRLPWHSQMGGGELEYQTNIRSRYDYFKQIYSSNRGKPLYASLEVPTLCFVVDTPVPVDELSWALKNVRGTRGSWKKQFFKIVYDKKRMDDGVYSWPHGAYTLSSILENGGICVDQAYFATLSAKAHGIPAIYFHGPGRRGGHAWFAYMKGKTSWELDAGRYEYDKYATGYAIDPQTNRQMTDHDIAYTCEYSLRSRQYDTARSYARIAGILLENGEYQHARQCTRKARDPRLAAKYYELPWDIEIASWRKQGNLEAAVQLLEKKAKMFSRYPDIATRTREEQSRLLHQMGRKDEAKRLLARQTKRVARDRDDLAQRLISRQVDDSLSDGDIVKARRRMEKLLKDQRKEGNKVIPMLHKYLELTLETGQTHEASRFIKVYVNQLMNENRASAKNQRIYLGWLLRAYRNDKNTSGIRRTKRRLERLGDVPGRSSRRSGLPYVARSISPTSLFRPPVADLSCEGHTSLLLSCERSMVLGGGFEPPQPCGHQALNLTRLPFRHPSRNAELYS